MSHRRNGREQFTSLLMQTANCLDTTTNKSKLNPITPFNYPQTESKQSYQLQIANVK